MYSDIVDEVCHLFVELMNKEVIIDVTEAKHLNVCSSISVAYLFLIEFQNTTALSTRLVQHIEMLDLYIKQVNDILKKCPDTYDKMNDIEFTYFDTNLQVSIMFSHMLDKILTIEEKHKKNSNLPIVSKYFDFLSIEIITDYIQHNILNQDQVEWKNIVLNDIADDWCIIGDVLPIQ